MHCTACCHASSNVDYQHSTSNVQLTFAAVVRCANLVWRAGAADRPVQEIKINNVVIHANPLAGA